MNNYTLGKKGEDLTKQDYLKNGYTFVDQNFQVYKNRGRGRVGELDLIFTKNNILVIVEVKSRNNSKFGHALAQIDPSKLNHIKTSYMYFVQRNSEYKNYFPRIDIATYQNGQLSIIKNAVQFS